MGHYLFIIEWALVALTASLVAIETANTAINGARAHVWTAAVGGLVLTLLVVAIAAVAVAKIKLGN